MGDVVNDVRADKNVNLSKKDNGFDLVKILQNSQKKSNSVDKQDGKEKDINSKTLSGEEKDSKANDVKSRTLFDDEKTIKIKNNDDRVIKKRMEHQDQDSVNKNMKKEISEQIEKENAMKIQQQNENERLQEWMQKQEMQEMMRKMKQNALKEKIKKEIKEENEAKKDSNNFGNGGDLSGVFGKAISAQTDYAQDAMQRIKKIEDDLKDLCDEKSINDAFANFDTSCDDNDKKFDEKKATLSSELNKEIKKLKNDFDVPTLTAQLDANELLKAVFSYVGDDLSTNIGGYALICNKISEYKKNFPIQKMEYDEESGKEKNVLDPDVVEERKILNTQLDSLLDNTDLFSADAVKEEIVKRYKDISLNNATGAIMTFIYAVVDFILGKNRHKSKAELCEVLWEIYNDVGDVKSFEKVNEAKKRLLANYDKYNDILAYMPTWIFYPELCEVDKKGNKRIKNDILKEFIDKVALESGYSDKVKYICQSLYKIVGGNSFHTLTNLVSKEQMDTIIDAVSSSDIVPIGMDRKLYKEIIRKTIELPPDTGKEKDDEPKKADKIMEALNVTNQGFRKIIENLCKGSIEVNKDRKSGKSSIEKKSFAEAKFWGDKLMVENDAFDAKKKAVKGLMMAVSNGLELNIDKTMSYLCNINSIDIDVGTKTIMDNHKNRLKAMVEAKRTALIGVVEEKFSDDGGGMKEMLEKVKKMVDKVKKKDYYDKENDGPKVGKMPKYNDLDSFDFRDLSDETNKTREALKESINKTFDRMLEKIDRIGIDITHDKQKISSMMKEISDGTRKDYKEIEMEKAKYNAQTMNALLEANKNRGRGGFGMMPIGSI